MSKDQKPPENPPQADGNQVAAEEEGKTPKDQSGSGKTGGTEKEVTVRFGRHNRPVR